MTKTRNKIKIMSLFLALVMMIGSLSVFSVTASAADDITVNIDTSESVTLKDSDGDGAYEIGTADELYAFAAAVNGGNIAINGELIANITVNENVISENGTLNGDGSNFRAWAPIGYFNSNTDFVRYVGSFDGGNHTISGLYFNNSEKNYVGLFGYLEEGGSVKNVGIVDSYVSARQYVGAVVGVNNMGSITSCFNSGTVYGNENIGGVAGYINHAAISNCYNSGYVSSAAASVGGVIGNNNFGTIANCYNVGNINGGSNYVGGVVGKSYNGTISHCYNNGSVAGLGNSIGGVAGTTGTSIINSYNTGSVSGLGEASTYVGGVVGEGSGSVTNCYNLGSVSGYMSIGGVIGEALGNVANCYNIGSISGTAYNFGGIAGNSLGYVSNCYYLNTCGAFGVGEYVTADRFKSGEIAMLLQNGVAIPENEEKAPQIWGQNLGENRDEYPVLYGIAVYYGYLCGESVRSYSNNSRVSQTPINHAYENLICKYCDAYEPAKYNAENNCYEISNGSQLYWFARLVNIGGKPDANAILMADIDLGGKNWYPIGLYNDPAEAGGELVEVQYSGIFNGNNYTVSNFVAVGNGAQGLIGYGSSTARIHNLGVNNATVSGSNAGAILAYYGTVENCYATNCTVTASATANLQNTSAGALAGAQNTVVKNSFAADCKVVAENSVSKKATLAPVGGEAVENTYYVNVTASNKDFRESDNEIKLTQAQLEKGEVAYYLGSAWGQEIGKDAHPVPGATPVTEGYYFYGQQLNVGSDLSMKYYVIAYGEGVNADALKMQFLHLGRLTEAKAVYDTEVGAYMFIFEGINPQCMGDGIDARFFVNGQEKGSKLGYTVEENLLALREEYGDNEKLLTLVNDLLAYGTASGDFTNHKEMTNDYVAADKEIPESSVMPSGSFKGYTVVFGKTHTIKIRLNLDNSCRLVLNGEDVTFYVVGGIYETSPIALNDLDKKFTFEIRQSGVVLETLTICVNDYLFMQKDSETMGALARSLYNCGVSADHYIHTLQKEHYVGPATCLHGRICENCDYVYDTIIDLTNHDPNNEYDNDGYCISCGGYEAPVLTTDKYDIDDIEGYDAVYEISKPAHLYWFADKVNNDYASFGNANAILTKAIYINGNLLSTISASNPDTSNLREWTPIGSIDAPYAGAFYGNGYVISGLYVNKPDENNIGLFGVTGSEAYIRDVTIWDSYFHGNENVGAIAGYANGYFLECSVSANVFGVNCVGGIAGRSYASLRYCSASTGKILATENHVGGMVGYNYGQIVYCNNIINVTGKSFVGGIAGSNAAVIKNCYNLATITGETEVGGIAGYCSATSETNYATVMYCYHYSGKVVGNSNLGAIVGKLERTDVDAVAVCFYLTSSITDDNGETWRGVGNIDKGTEEVKATVFNSQEIVDKLNGDQEDRHWKSGLFPRFDFS